MLWGVRSTWAAVAAICLVPAAATVARAQAVQADAEAYTGEPFGVACVNVDLPASEAPQPLGWRGLKIEEKGHREFYPAIDSQSFAGVAKQLLSNSRRPLARIAGGLIENRGKATIYFLFVGRDPLDVTIQSRVPHEMHITPVNDPAGRKRLLDAWWAQYNAGHGFFLGRQSYPPIVENYLRAMLAKRLGLAVPEQPQPESWQEELMRTVSLVTGSESLRLQVERQAFLNPPAKEAADLPLPQPIQGKPSPAPQPVANVAVEPLALHVPAECLYVRFGSFANFLWFQDALGKIGGDFENLVASRGVDGTTRQRFEVQLAAQTGLLSRFFGDAVVADAAIIGTDLFLNEGGAYGLLFQARSSDILRRDILAQRAQWKEKIPGAAETHLTIDGHDVSLLASPDGRIRSYYVVDGNFQLIATSKTLARRFLEVRSGKGSLGQSRGFRYARSIMPTSRNDTVFVCLSTAFYRNLLSPQYRIEMMRRVKAAADIDLVQMALRAAAGEEKAQRTIAELVAGGFLPAGFGPQPDGSHTVLNGPKISNSLRGIKDFFVPIPDIQVKSVTPSEAAAYEQLADTYQSTWAEVPPLFAGIQRRPIGKDRDQVTIGLRTTPLTKKTLERVRKVVGKAGKQRVAPAPGDAVSFDLVLAERRVFGGIERVGRGLEIVDGIVLPLGRLRNLLYGYVGTVGEGCLLNRLPFRPTGPPDVEGYTRGQRGLWRRTVDSFNVYSFQREVLEQVTPQLHFENTDREAQLRLDVSDLSRSSLAPLVNAWGFARTKQTALGNVEFVHQIIEQFHVPPDTALNTAEALLGLKLVCPLGGQYVFRQTPQGVPYWTSTVLERLGHTASLVSQMPEGYQAPPLNWFRGLKADGVVTSNDLSARLQLDMKWPEATPKTAQRPE